MQVDPEQMEVLKTFSALISSSIHAIDEIKKVQSQMDDLKWEAKAKVFCDVISPKMVIARDLIDRLEMVVDDNLWLLPKYRELLFVL
jgi:glutamine synthetase